MAPNSVFTVVALKLIWVPTTVDDTFVPIVWVAVWFASAAAVVLIPVALNEFNNLTSAIVHEYPAVSNT